MFMYYLRLAFISLRKNPVLSGLMVIAIGLGIGACMTMITVNYMMSADPIPQKSERLFYVRLDNWSPYQPAQEPNEPPDQVTFPDAMNLQAAGKAFRQSAMAQTGGVIEPEDKDIQPFQAPFRLANNDFFSMFDVPFLYGGPWSDSADDNGDFVVVLTRETNDQLFGGRDSVGENIRIMAENFTVVGVIDDWQPAPKFYDLTTGAFSDVEDAFMPFMIKRIKEVPTWGNVNCWKSPDGTGYDAFMNSECVHNQFWVELESADDKAEYMAFLDSYVNEQKALGRFPRDINNRMDNVTEWLLDREVVPDDARIMLWLSLMFLLVCLLNTIGLMLAKFTAKAGEIGLRRAIGAAKGDLFYQYLVETLCIGVLGGLLGLLLALAGLSGIKMLFGDFVENVAHLDISLITFAIGLSLISAVLAGLYPTWRACSIAPAAQLKVQ